MCWAEVMGKSTVGTEGDGGDLLLLLELEDFLGFEIYSVELEEIVYGDDGQ